MKSATMGIEALGRSVAIIGLVIVLGMLAVGTAAAQGQGSGDGQGPGEDDDGFDTGKSDNVTQDVRVDYTGDVDNERFEALGGDDETACYLTRTRHHHDGGGDTRFTNIVQCENGYAHTATGVYKDDPLWDRSDGATAFDGVIKLTRLQVSGVGDIDVTDCDAIEKWVTFPGCDDDS